MRPVAVGRCDRIEHHELAGRESLMQERKGWMQSKSAVEGKGSIGTARRADRELAMQGDIIRIAVGRYCSESVECTAQNHDNQSRRTTGAGEQNPWERRARGQCSGAFEKAASTRSLVRKLTHRY